MTDEEKAKLPPAFRKQWEKNSNRSKDEAREMGRKGGIASGEVRRENKTLAEIAKTIDAMPMTAETMREIAKRLGVPEDFIANMTQKEAKVFAANKKILTTGSMKDLIEWAKMIGEYTETLKVDGLPETPVGDRLFTKKDKE